MGKVKVFHDNNAYATTADTRVMTIPRLFSKKKTTKLKRSERDRDNYTHSWDLIRLLSLFFSVKWILLVCMYTTSVARISPTNKNLILNPFLQTIYRMLHHRLFPDYKKSSFDVEI